MITDGGLHIELLSDCVHARIDGVQRRIGNPAWRILSALDEDWPLPLKTKEIAGACEVKTKVFAKFVDYARETLTPLGIILHYERATGYDLRGVEDLKHADDETTEIDLEDHAEDAVCIDACDAHLQDLRADDLITRLQIAAAIGTEVVIEPAFSRDFVAHLAERDAAAEGLLERIVRFEREAASLRDRLTRALDGDAYRWISAFEDDAEARAAESEARRLADVEAALREEVFVQVEEAKAETEASMRAEFSRTMAAKLSEAKAAMTRLLSGFGGVDEAA